MSEQRPQDYRLHEYRLDSYGHMVETTAVELGRLYTELVGSEVVVSPRRFAWMAASPQVCLLVACDEVDGIHAVIGTATLIVVETLLAAEGRIENVVVAPNAQGRGIGRAMTELLVYEARRRGLDRVELTSRPDRAAANALYRSLGFLPRETNVYRLML